MADHRERNRTKNRRVVVDSAVGKDGQGVETLENQGNLINGKAGNTCCDFSVPKG